MNCPSCNRANGPERNYCGACGVAMARYCARCGFRNLATDRFCGGCGTPLDSATLPASQPQDSRGPAQAPANSSGDDLAELLAVAQEGTAPTSEDPGARVNQADIDSLFED